MSLTPIRCVLVRHRYPLIIRGSVASAKRAPQAPSQTPAAPDQYLRAGPHHRVFVPRGEESGVGHGPPLIQTRIVDGACPYAFVIREERDSAPRHQLASRPDQACGGPSRPSLNNGRTRACHGGPPVIFWVVARPVEAPTVEGVHQQLIARPYGSRAGTLGCASARHGAPAVEGRVITRAIGNGVTDRWAKGRPGPISTPNQHFTAGPDRHLAHTRAGLTVPAHRAPAVCQRIVPAAPPHKTPPSTREVIAAPNDEFRSGPDGAMGPTRTRGILGRHRHPGGRWLHRLRVRRHGHTRMREQANTEVQGDGEATEERGTPREPHDPLASSSLSARILRRMMDWAVPGRRSGPYCATTSPAMTLTSARAIGTRLESFATG
jgi:hypothetical protein